MVVKAESTRCIFGRIFFLSLSLTPAALTKEAKSKCAFISNGKRPPIKAVF